MTVYNINLGIGWASSGVEYAQAYRAQLLRNIHEPAKFVFMDMILADNIQHLTENIGLRVCVQRDLGEKGLFLLHSLLYRVLYS